jgi:putative membrane protein
VFRSGFKLRRDLAHLARGFLMGGADIIPGVSGGTVALILGVYERLVTAISHVDLTLLDHLRKRRFAAAAAHLDLRFLAALGSGIALGILSLASLMHYLLEHHREPTTAALFGLIAASCVLVGTMVRRWSAGEAVGLLVGAVLAYWIVGVLPVVAPLHYGYLFFCGVVAICAMILPGVSGAFILVILGMYFHVTGVLKDVLHGEINLQNFLTILVFASGCAIGLVSFSKVLRWLLARHESLTMAVLCGFMAGSLRKIWPFKSDATLEYLDRLPLSAEQIARLKSSPAALAEVDDRYHIYRNSLPDQLSSDVMLAIGLAIAGAVLVFALDILTRGRRSDRMLRDSDHEPDSSAVG